MDKRNGAPEAAPDHYGTGRQPQHKRSHLSLTLLLLLVLIGTNLITAAFLMGYRAGKNNGEAVRSPTVAAERNPTSSPVESLPDLLYGGLAEVITTEGSQIGLVLSADGYILTTAFDGAPLEIRVGEESYRRVFWRGFSTECGLAVLRIPAEGLQTITIGFSGVLTAAEEGLIHVADPLSPQPHMIRERLAEQTELFLGGTERRLLRGDYEKGDLLLNDSGQLTAFCVETSEGVFALPMEEVINLAGELITFGALDAPYSPGIEITQLDEAQSYYWNLPGSIMVSRVETGSVAERIGLLEGDILLAVGGQEINDLAAFWQNIAAFAEGEPVSIRIYRGAEELEFLLSPDP